MVYNRGISMKLKTRDITLSGLFAALTAIMSQLSFTLPVTPVPVTLQVQAVALAGALGGKTAAMFSQIIYIAMGMIGLPVFAGFKTGVGSILGPNGGYIASFPIAALIISIIVEKFKMKNFLPIWTAMLAGLLTIYAIGAAWLSINQNINYWKALVIGAGVFLPLDILKTGAAAFISSKIRSHTAHSS